MLSLITLSHLQQAYAVFVMTSAALSNVVHVWPLCRHKLHG